MLMMATSCADPDLAPIVTFEVAGKGAYVRLISETDKLINLFDVPGSNYTYSVEFVDLEKGALIQEYVLDLVYVDNNPDNGDNSAGPLQFKSWSQGDFVTNADGFRGLTDITISALDVIAAAGTTADDVKAGDEFRIVGKLVMPDGAIFAAANSSAAVNGPSFRGHFNFTLPAGCPSSLEGSYEYEGSDYWCNGGTGSGSVEFKSLGGGEYTIDDWSFGSYAACYGPGAVAGSASLKFKDTCAEISFTGFTDVYGDTWTFVSSIDGNRWSIAWDNTYGESGKVDILYKGGADWPLTLK